MPETRSAGLIGREIAAKLAKVPVPDDELGHVKFPKCAICGRRPELRKRPGAWLRFRTGADGAEFIDVPRYEIIPCCSGKYLVEIFASKKQLRRLNGQVKVARSTVVPQAGPAAGAPAAEGPAE